MITGSKTRCPPAISTPRLPSLGCAACVHRLRTPLGFGSSASRGTFLSANAPWSFANAKSHR
eukprot:12423559-Heterocapsa_arctica.AAC.1